MGVLFYAMTSTAALFILFALPQLFKPYELGTKMYLPFKLPESTTAQKQMAFFQFTIAVTNVFYGAFMLWAANYSLTIGVAIVPTVTIFIFCAWAANLHFSGTSEACGMDPKAFYGQVSIFALLGIFLVVGITQEMGTVAMTTPTNMESPALTYMVVGFCGLQVLNSAPGLIAPTWFLSQYWPLTKFPDRICEKQMSVYVTGSMLGNFLLSSFVASLMLMSDDIYSIGALFAVQGLVWSCIMGHMIIDAQEYGADVKMIVPWIILIGVITGATGVISFMEVLA